MREEDRLAATLWKIEQDALIIPRGSYILQPTGEVERNRTFEGFVAMIVLLCFLNISMVSFTLGLTSLESGKLSNYFHFRPPIRLEQKSLLYRAALDKSIHFLDSIDEDLPKGNLPSPRLAFRNAH